MNKAFELLQRWGIVGACAVALFAFVLIVKDSDPANKAGFVVLGALLSVGATFLIESQKRHVLTRDLARALYAELTHLAARCVFDSEGPWKDYWPKDAAPGLMLATKLRKFMPVVPTIYHATAGQLALLPGEAPQTLIEFYYRLSALRREIENAAADANSSNNKNVPIGEMRQVGLRFRQTLAPSLKALEALAPLVEDAAKIEELARTSYYESRPGSDMTLTLRERVKVLLAEPHSLEGANKAAPA